jgi:hypothetical protein
VSTSVGQFFGFVDNHQFWVFLKNHNEGRNHGSHVFEIQCVNLHVKCIISIEVIAMEEAKNWRQVLDSTSPKLYSKNHFRYIITVLNFLKRMKINPPIKPSVLYIGAFMKIISSLRIFEKSWDWCFERTRTHFWSI